jgi:DNA adenine methylase
MPYTIRKVKDGYKVCKKDEPKTCFSNKGLTKEKAEKQKTAIIISELKGGLKPLTARIGGKVLLKKKIVDDYFPPSDSYSTYVEPFVGGGSIYFYKNKDDHKEVINDIDPDIITIFRGFQKYPAKKISDDVNGDYDENDFEDIKDSKPKGDYNRFLKTFLLYKLSYFGRGISFGKPRINSKFDGYNERLEGVDIQNTDYKNIIKQYNQPSTFFYLDPPARDSSGKYRFSAVDIPELVKLLKTIKGKFLLSIADIDVKKDVFKPYKIITVPTKYVGYKTKGGQTLKTKEYLIMNYEPSNDLRGGMCGGCMGACGGAVSEFQSKLDKMGLKPSLYLKKAREMAEKNGYDPKKVIFCTRGTNKLQYEGPDGSTHFGNPDYPDYIIYTWLEHIHEVDEGTADKRRELYRARATKIKGNWKKNKYSANNLAINILW